MENKLIILDLDGTLLYDWTTLTDNSVNYLIKLQELNHKIVIATGRPLRSSITFYNKLKLNTPIINYNGSLISNPRDNNFKIIDSTFDKEYIYNIVANNSIYIENAFSEIHDDVYLYKKDENIAPLLQLLPDTKVFIGDFCNTLKEDPHGFIIISKDDKGELIEEYIKNTFNGNLLCRNWGKEYKNIIEVYTPKTNKGIAIKHVANYLGFTLDNTIAFGDAHNDIELIKTAGTGIAMKNARQELLDVADEITEYTNTEEGVIKHLRNIFK